MTCRTDTATFRLLDGYVGWDGAAVDGLRGAAGTAGLSLAYAQASGDIRDDEIPALFGSPRLAHGCGACEWYLVTPPADIGAVPPARLLRRDGCGAAFRPLWPRSFGNLLEGPTAVAARRTEIAVSDAGAGRVLVWAGGGRTLVASIPIARPGPLCFSDSGQLLVAIAGTTNVRRFSPSGDDLGRVRIRAAGTIEQLALGSDCSVWAVVRRPDGSAWLYRAARAGQPFVPATLAAARAALAPTGVTVVAAAGFCLEERGSGGTTTHCYSWYGEPADSIAPPAGPTYVSQGQLLTAAIDSGVERCRWHRVRIDADLPDGTGIATAVATADDATAAAQGIAATDPLWQAFPAGVPHPADWHEAPGGSLDFLVDQPTGRYLYVRLRLTATGAATPTVRRVRLDFPRVTSADLLPAVYHEPPEAEDFTERFLSLFDASIEELDRAIERHPALLDVAGVPDEALPWLGTFLDLASDPSWEPARYRRLLAAAPQLYRMRGTPGGLAEAVELAFGVRPALVENAAHRAWGAVGKTAQVSSVRLFSRGRSRLRLGSSPLAKAPLRSTGNPDLDPLTVDAYRFSVLVPAGAVRGAGRLDSLRRLVAAQAPAHTVPAVRVGGDGFVVGSWSAVGIDTAFGALPAPVLGSSVRLSRASVLWPGPHAGRGFSAGAGVAVGIATVTR